MQKIMVCFVVLLATPSTFAFRFAPIYATLKPTGKENSATFTVENNQNEKIAIQFRIVKRAEDLEGTETNDPATEFNLFPDQLLMTPGQTKKVRLTWTGKTVPDHELPFRLLAEQLEVQGLEGKAKDKAAKIKILMAYRASVYVEPPNVEPDVVAEDTQVIVNPQNPKESQLSLLLSNNGKKHQVMVEPVVDVGFVDQDEKPSTVSLEGKDVAGLADSNLLPGGKRKFILPWNRPVPKGPLKISLKVKKE